MGKLDYLYDRKYNSYGGQRERADRILKADVSIAEKLLVLAYNPFSNRNIVEYIVKNGIDLTNLFHPEELLDEQGNDFRDFLESDNNFYFGCIQTCLMNIDPDEIILVSGEKEVDLTLFRRAVDMWDKLNELLMLPDEDWEMEEIVEYYQKASSYIDECAESVFEECFDKEKQAYVQAQQKILKEEICERLSKGQVVEFFESLNTIISVCKDFSNKF